MGDSDQQRAIRPFTYFAVSACLLAAFWPAAGTVATAYMTPDEVATVLRGITIDYSIPSLIARSAAVLVPVLAVAHLGAYVLRLGVPARERWVASMAYAFGSQAMLVVAAISLTWIWRDGSAQWLVIGILGVGLVAFLAFFLVFSLIPAVGILALSSIVANHRDDRPSRLRFVFAAIISSVLGTCSWQIGLNALETIEKSAQRDRLPPVRLWSSSAVVRRSETESELELLYTAENTSEDVWFIGKAQRVRIAEFRRGRELLTWAGGVLPAEIIEWSGPPGEVLVIAPGEGAWIKMRLVARDPSIATKLAAGPTQRDLHAKVDPLWVDIEWEGPWQHPWIARDRLYLISAEP